MPLGLLSSKVRLLLILAIYILLLCGCGEPTPRPTLVPAATPATPRGRVDGYLRELTITLSRLERDVLRIEANRSDGSLVALVGTSIFLDYWSLQDMHVPSRLDTREVGIEEDYTEAHKWLLGSLYHCKLLGGHAQYDEQNEAMVTAILEAQDVCKVEVKLVKDKYPKFFICPPGEGTCR